MKLDAAIKITKYIILIKYNYKNPLIAIEIENIPFDAIELYKRENRILAYKRDIEDIVKWLVWMFPLATGRFKQIYFKGPMLNMGYMSLKLCKISKKLLEKEIFLWSQFYKLIYTTET